MDSTHLHPYYHEERLRGHHHGEMIPHSHSTEHRDHIRSVDSLESSSRRSRSAVPERRRRHGSDDSDDDDVSSSTHSRRTRSRDRTTASSSSRSQHAHRRPRSEDPAARKRYEHAIEKAIGAGSAAAFHVRDHPGSWVGGKGLKVVGAASAAALIDYALDRDPKNHKFRHIAVSMFQGAMIETILTGGNHSN